MTKPVDFKIIFDQLARSLGLDRAELLRRVGMSEWAYYKWRDGNEPSLDNLSRIEYEFGVEFVRNKEGRIEALKPVDQPRTDTKRESNDPPARAIPNSAREFYERFEFHGGKVDWIEMEDEQRSFYENIYAFLVHAVDSANEKYEASLNEIKATREREIRAALEDFEKTFRKRMLGLLGS
jgi:transcriptional regulator with XRE-family HTH domain